MTLPTDRDHGADTSVRVTVALDVLGGDDGPEVVADAALQVLDQQSGVDLILVGPTDLTHTLAADRGIADRVAYAAAGTALAMDEDPVRAIRTRSAALKASPEQPLLLSSLLFIIRLSCLM
jgi:fatty acid/phospholipid biosynthesis enzyme